MRRGPKSTKQYNVGDRLTLYLKQESPPELINLINEQEDLTLFLMHSMELYHAKYGVTDVEDVLPRKYKLFDGMSDNHFSPPISKRKINKSPESPKTEQETNLLEEESNSAEETEHLPDIDTEKKITNKKKDSWSNINLDDDPYA